MSFQQGLSGLNASSKNLEVIGNNIANANTYGTKVARAEFSDMYANAISGAGTNNIPVGEMTKRGVPGVWTLGLGVSLVSRRLGPGPGSRVPCRCSCRRQGWALA